MEKEKEKKEEGEIMANKNPKGTENPFIFVLEIPFVLFFVYMTTPEFEAIRWG